MSVPKAYRESTPLGIKIICIFTAIIPFITVVGAIGLLDAPGAGPAVAFVLLFIAAALLAIVYGLWTLRPWGWTAGMFLFGLDLLYGFVQFNVLSIVISLALLWYLFSKRDLYWHG